MPRLPKRVQNWLENLRFPVLLLITVVAFLVNLATPDPLPFVDEILLALVALLLARVKRRGRKPESPNDEE